MMSIWQSCKCKSCGYEWKYEMFSLHGTNKSDYNTQYCEKCKIILEDKKRKQYFDDNTVTSELEDYKYVLECIRNSDSWIQEDNPLCTVESAYDKCVEMVDKVLSKYNN